MSVTFDFLTRSTTYNFQTATKQGIQIQSNDVEKTFIQWFDHGPKKLYIPLIYRIWIEIPKYDLAIEMYVLKDGGGGRNQRSKIRSDKK